MSKTYEIEIQKDQDTNDLFFELPPVLMEKLGWKPGDDLKWEETENGGFRCRKIKYETVELDFDDEELFKYMQIAQKRGQSFDEFVNEALNEVIQSVSEK